MLSRFEALRSGATPLVGRDEELELLIRRWEQAKSGEGRVVLISGEPGIGKSRLTAAALDGCAETIPWSGCIGNASMTAHPHFAALDRLKTRIQGLRRAIVGKLDGDAEKRARAAARLNPRRFGGDREGPAGQLPAAIVFSSSISAARLSQSRPIVSTANLRPLCR
jgi:AAA ATPase domain